MRRIQVQESVCKCIGMEGFVPEHRSHDQLQHHCREVRIYKYIYSHHRVQPLDTAWPTLGKQLQAPIPCCRWALLQCWHYNPILLDEQKTASLGLLMGLFISGCHSPQDDSALSIASAANVAFVNDLFSPPAVHLMEEKFCFWGDDVGTKPTLCHVAGERIFVPLTLFPPSLCCPWKLTLPFCSTAQSEHPHLQLCPWPKE